MNAGTKVFLAVVALLVGVMILYYGVLQPGDHPSPAMGNTAHGPEAPLVRTAPPTESGRTVVAPALRIEPTNQPKPEPKSDAQNPIPPASDPLADLGVTSTANPNGLLTETVTHASSNPRGNASDAAQPPAAQINGSSHSSSGSPLAAGRTAAPAHEIKPATPTPHADVQPLSHNGSPGS